MKEVKQFQFKKGDHIFSYLYDDTKEFVNALVDVADSEKSVLELLDVETVLSGVCIFEKSRSRILGSKIMIDIKETEK